MSNDCNGGICVADLGNSKIENFDYAINMCERFEIVGLDESETHFVIRDLKKAEGEEGAYVKIAIQEVEDAPLDSVLKVLKGERSDVAVKGYTRIVGYYSGVHNWNKSKLGELRDRHEGIYGERSFKPRHQDETKSSLYKLAVGYGN